MSKLQADYYILTLPWRAGRRLAMLPLADQHRPGCGRGHHHRRRRRNLAAQAAFFVLGSLVIYICFGSSPSRTVDHGLESPARRHLLQTPGTGTEDPAEKDSR